MKSICFYKADNYSQWLNNHSKVVIVHSVVVFDDVLVITYETKGSK